MASKQLELHEFVNKKNIVNYLSFNFLILQGIKVTIFGFKNTLNDIIPKVSLKSYNNRYSSQKAMGLILKINPKIPPLLMDKCKIDLVSLLKGTNLK